MKLFKGLAAALLAAVLGAQCLMPVGAQEVYDSRIGEVYVDGLTDVDESRLDDPGYLKYLAMEDRYAGQAVTLGEADGTTAQAVYGSSDLNHSSAFSGVKKTYCIDVSENQTWKGAINWNNVKAAGVTDVIVRLGYRGYGSWGTLMLDNSFYQNLDGAKAAGMNVGVYFFTQAVTEAEAKAEADFCLKYLKGYSLELPVYLDCESIEYAYARYDHSGLTYNSRTNLAMTFCDRIAAGGYKAGVYGNGWWLRDMMNGAYIGQNYHIWVASYQSYVGYYTGAYDMWQYTGYGWVNGVPTYVDINVHYNVRYAPSAAPTISKSGSSLTWKKVSDADGYVVYSRDKSGNDKAIITVAETSYTPSNTSGLSYYVRAYTKFGGYTYYSDASNLVALGPAKVTGLGAMVNSSTSITLHWTNAALADSYEVASVSGKTYTKLLETPLTVKVISGLKPETTYKFAVRGKSSTDVGEYSDIVTVTTPPKPIAKGDADKSGKIDNNDLSVFLAHIKGTKKITDTRVLDALDLNGDGKSNETDMGIMISYIKGQRASL